MSAQGQDATPALRAEAPAVKPDQLARRRRRRPTVAAIVDPGGAAAASHRGRVPGTTTPADRLLRAAMDALSDQLYILDVDTMRFVDANAAAQQLSGFGLAELWNTGPERLLQTSAEDARAFCGFIENAGAAGVRNETLGVNRVGQQASVEALHAAFRHAGRRYVVSTVRDIRARKAEEASHRRLRDMYVALCGTNEAILRATSPDDLFDRVCTAAVEGGFLGAAVYVPRDGDERARLATSSGPVHALLAGMDVGFGDHRTQPSQIITRAYRELTPQYLRERDYKRIDEDEASALQAVGIRSAAALPIRRDGRCVGVLAFASREPDAFEPEVRGLLVRMSDNIAFGLAGLEALAERERAERRAAYLATHDVMTGLPNRALFAELLTQALHTARRQQSRLAVLFIDLDRFKVINDSLGHDAGDALLRTMAQRLRHTLRASDVVARLGGDEFVVLLPEVPRRAEAATVARKLLQAIQEPLTLEGHECRCSASVGIALFPDTASDEQTLMSNADAAMYRAKHGGRNSVQFFARGSRHVTTHQLTLESQLRGALERDEFTLVYQPKLELATGVITGVEALLRWHNAQLGAVTPAEFIPIAEETGLIEDIGRWVLRTACAQNVAWQAAGCRHVSIAVNLSANQFLGRSLVRDIDEALAVTGMNPKLLELEITESMVVQNPLRAREILTAIKARGVRLAIDDFGTGYSSLGQLRNFPIDTLKVDRSFVADLATDAEDRVITRAIIAMGKTLSLTVVAEGVETPEQVAFLKASACDEVQGFYFGRPQPASQLAARLR